ncbi:hypothetical protein EDB19DRAFT_218772 [Suillus lakei]|nr:hypothetical protein EDB19DRAFT_218772 [Suillus lakei]
MSNGSQSQGLLSSLMFFNGDVNLAMQNAQISTATYADRVQNIIEQPATRQERWIKTPPSVQDVDAMLRNARETSGKSSERYTACAISACLEINEQVNLARTQFMYLLWPFTTRSHHPSDSISSQATPTFDNTLISVAIANLQRRSPFKSDVNRRDGCRCVISGMWDVDRTPADSNRVFDNLECRAHPETVRWCFQCRPARQ